mgnify:CR=1 FL=1
MRSQSLQSLPTSLGSNEKLERLRHEALHFGDEKSHESLQSELTRTRNGPFLEELQLVQQRLAERLVNLDEAMRSKDQMLEDMHRRLTEVSEMAETHLRRASEAEEEVQVLRRALAAKTEELQRFTTRN